MSEKRTSFAGEAAAPDELLRDRLLLYVKVLRLPVRAGLEMVLQTMEEYKNADASVKMTEMRAALKKRVEEAGYGIDGEEMPRYSVPRYNRGTMPPARLKAASGRGIVRFLNGLRPEPKIQVER